jgi:hypothetical protein
VGPTIGEVNDAVVIDPPIGRRRGADRAEHEGDGENP